MRRSGTGFTARQIDRARARGRQCEAVHAIAPNDRRNVEGHPGSRLQCARGCRDGAGSRRGVRVGERAFVPRRVRDAASVEADGRVVQRVDPQRRGGRRPGEAADRELQIRGLRRGCLQLQVRRAAVRALSVRARSADERIGNRRRRQGLLGGSGHAGHNGEPCGCERAEYNDKSRIPEHRSHAYPPLRTPTSRRSTSSVHQGRGTADRAIDGNEALFADWAGRLIPKVPDGMQPQRDVLLAICKSYSDLWWQDPATDARNVVALGSSSIALA